MKDLALKSFKMAPPPRPPPPPPPAPPPDPSSPSIKMELGQGGQGGGQRVGGRQRDNSQVYAAESEALDQIAKEVRNDFYHESVDLLTKIMSPNT